MFNSLSDCSASALCSLHALDSYEHSTAYASWNWGLVHVGILLSFLFIFIAINTRAPHFFFACFLSFFFCFDLLLSLASMYVVSVYACICIHFQYIQYIWLGLFIFVLPCTQTHIHFPVNGNLYCQWEKYGVMVESKNLQFDHFSKFVVLLSYLWMLLDSGQKWIQHHTSNIQWQLTTAFSIPLHSGSILFYALCTHTHTNTRAHCLHWWYNL